MNLKTKTTMLCVACLWLSLGQANGATLFTDRADFVNAVTGETVIDFEDAQLGNIFGDPWLSEGIIFDEAGVGDHMQITDAGGVNIGISARGGENADILVTLVNPGLAFGLEIFSNNNQSPSERIIFLNTSGLVIADIEMPLTDILTGSFIGIVSDEAIASIMIMDDLDGDYMGIAEVIFTTPIPAATWLLVSALGMLGLVNRRGFHGN